jgi:hypothetical protein
MPRLQHDVVSLLSDVLPHGSIVAVEAAPTWLVRPGRAECLDVWPLVQDVYRSLTDRALPEQMPERERRRLDAVITYPNGRQRVFEVDERQHFTSSRMITLGFYSGTVRTDFSVAAWLDRCHDLRGREPGGGFARPCPPLFPDAGGRHRQRAFRDFLADTLPIAHGWLPTMRISDDEARTVLAGSDSHAQMGQLVTAKTSAQE